MALWAIAILIVSLGPIAAFWVPGLGRSDTRTWDVEGHHFSERCGLFIIIALGELILVTGAAFGETPWTPATIAAFASAFVGTVAMWWLYFDIGAERAARQLAQDKDPGRMARLAYTYFHIPIVAGIIVTAASDEMAVAHPGGHAGPGEIAALLGGPALYLFGNMIFKRTNAPYFPLSHMVGLGLLGAGRCAVRRAAVAAPPVARRDRDAGARRRLGDGLAARNAGGAQDLTREPALERGPRFVHCRAMADFAALREEMVRRQIAARGIGDERLLAAMREVPREAFVADRAGRLRL